MRRILLVLAILFSSMTAAAFSNVPPQQDGQSMQTQGDWNGPYIPGGMTKGPPDEPYGQTVYPRFRNDPYMRGQMPPWQQEQIYSGESRENGPYGQRPYDLDLNNQIIWDQGQNLGQGPFVPDSTQERPAGNGQVHLTVPGQTGNPTWNQEQNSQQPVWNSAQPDGKRVMLHFNFNWHDGNEKLVIHSIEKYDGYAPDYNVGGWSYVLTNNQGMIVEQGNFDFSSTVCVDTVGNGQWTGGCMPQVNAVLDLLIPYHADAYALIIYQGDIVRFGPFYDLPNEGL